MPDSGIHFALRVQPLAALDVVHALTESVEDAGEEAVNEPEQHHRKHIARCL